MGLEEIVKKPYVENDQALCFKTTAITKIIVLSVLSFGGYLVILAFNYWKTLKDHFGYVVSPFWRGLFVNYTNIVLFPIIEKYFKNYNISIIRGDILGIIYLLSIISYNIYTSCVEKLFAKNIQIEAFFFVLAILVPIIIFVFIQYNINEINEQYYPNAPKNQWGVANTIWTIILSMLFILIILGMSMA